jgi:hypothetical protein
MIGDRPGGGYSCARPPGAARHGNSPEPPALPADGPPRMPAVANAASTSRTDPRASRVSGGGIAYPAIFASSSKYSSPRRSYSKSHGVDSGPNRSFRPLDFSPKRSRTARNGANRAETAPKRKRSLPGVGDNLRREPCDLRAIVRTPEAHPETGGRRARAHRRGRVRTTLIGESNQRPNKVLARRRGRGTLKVLISPPCHHRKGSHGPMHHADTERPRRGSAPIPSSSRHRTLHCKPVSHKGLEKAGERTRTVNIQLGRLALYH